MARLGVAMLAIVVLSSSASACTGDRTAAPVPGTSAPAATAAAHCAGSGRISFTRYSPPASHVFAMNADGTGVTQITDGTGVQAHSAWSPDGATVAYSSVGSTASSIMSVDVRAGRARTLNKGTPWSIVPSWSPDGKRIAFTRDVNGNFEIYTMAADGTDLKQLTFTYTHPTTSYVGPKYSPDGTQLLFALQRPQDAKKGLQDLWLMRTDGTDMRQLTHGYNNAESRSWSPDGRRIVFNAVVHGVGQIFTVNADGTNLRQLTHNPGTTKAFSPGGIFPALKGDITPAWSPNGCRIAFASDRAGNFDIYTMNPDGSDVVRLTSTPQQELSVGWGP